MNTENKKKMKMIEKELKDIMKAAEKILSDKNPNEKDVDTIIKDMSFVGDKVVNVILNVMPLEEKMTMIQTKFMMFKEMAESAKLQKKLKNGDTGYVG